MAQSDFDPHDVQTPLYRAGPGGQQAQQQQQQHGRRPGPLSARLAARARETNPPTLDTLVSSPYPADTVANSDETGTTGGPASDEYLPTGELPLDWGQVTGQLRLDTNVTDAVHRELSFAATWNSRSEMLRNCLDEYYRLAASYNEARRLLEQIASDLETLRHEQLSANARMREVESRLEFHSRTELRSVYLGAAETEVRLFRVQQEHDLLQSRSEILEGFMTFLSRIIATVRAIAPNVAIGDANTQQTADEEGHSPEMVLSVNDANAPRVTATPDDDGDYEEFVVDEREAAALAASGEFEIVETVNEPTLKTGPDTTEVATPETSSDAAPEATLETTQVAMPVAAPVAEPADPQPERDAETDEPTGVKSSGASEEQRG